MALKYFNLKILNQNRRVACKAEHLAWWREARESWVAWVVRVVDRDDRHGRVAEDLGKQKHAACSTPQAQAYLEPYVDLLRRTLPMFQFSHCKLDEFRIEGKSFWTSAARSLGYRKLCISQGVGSQREPGFTTLSDPHEAMCGGRSICWHKLFTSPV